MKITAIEEVHDLKTLKFDELMGSLMTFELSLPKTEKKHKGVALKGSIHKQKDQVYSDSDSDIDDTIAMLARNYSRVMKRFNQMNEKNVSQDVKDKFQQRFQKDANPHRNSDSGDRPGKGKGIQCHECEGFGHIQKECPNFLKKQKKGYNTTLSDEEDENSDSDQIRNFVAFTSILMSLLMNLVNALRNLF